MSLDLGDAACYVTVRDDAGGLVGQQVTLEREPKQILADSCQGDPECTDTKSVDLVVAVKPG